MTCLLKKKKTKQHTHARQVISNGFTNMCALGTIEEETPELLPFRVKIHPQALPLWGLCMAPPMSRPCRPPRLQLGGHTDAGKTVCPALTCWAPSASSPGFSRCLHGSRRFHGDLADEASMEVSRARSHRVSRRGCGMGLDERKGQTL